MTLLTFWNYFTCGALLLSSLTFALLFLAEGSYWLMRLFFAVAIPVTTPLILLAPMIAITLALASLLEFRLRMRTIWKIALWLSVFALSFVSFSGAILTKYELIASASFDNRKYYLIKFLYLDSSGYKLYSCEPLGLLCRRSSEHVGIPYEDRPIYLQYNSKTRKIYIQNVDQTIQIPD